MSHFWLCDFGTLGQGGTIFGPVYTTLNIRRREELVDWDWETNQTTPWLHGCQQSVCKLATIKGAAPRATTKYALQTMRVAK
eukprot:4597217-Amphidinium_carterae.1